MKKMLSSFLWAFYVIIVMYVFFAVLHINTLVNFISAMVFEIIGFFALTYLMIGNIFSNPIKVGYLAPLVMVTVIYTIILDIINIAFVVTMNPAIFVLVNLILLFIYCVITIPMYLMGRR